MEDLEKDEFEGWSDVLVDVYRNGEVLEVLTLEEVRKTVQAELERLPPVE
jgi:hypothetical protein